MTGGILRAPASNSEISKLVSIQWCGQIILLLFGSKVHKTYYIFYYGQWLILAQIQSLCLVLLAESDSRSLDKKIIYNFFFKLSSNYCFPINAAVILVCTLQLALA